MALDRSAVLVSAFLTAAVPAAQAQTPPQDEAKRPDDGRDIVVTGKRRGANETTNEIRAISDMQEGQLPRFETPICPVAIGMPRPHGVIIETRVRQVAGRLKLRVDKAGCKPNLTIVMAENGTAFVNALRRKRPTLFDTMPLHDRMRLLASAGPSWTWQSTAPKRRDGGPVAGADMPGSRSAYTVLNAEMSRLSVPVRQEVDLAFVVIDRRKSVGLTLGQIADYAAMVGLAAIRTDRPAQLGRSSILTMFDDVGAGQAAQPEMTGFDLAYLGGLYSGQSGFSGDRKAALMAQRIDRDEKP
ncbi:hypothetical protein [Sphingomonas sp. PB4P5]|uniref:hypothetical protein n=1 Tax=Parasphingomonas puruogangriensis TaxID=3096155 RepID=UPI002FC9991D